MKKRCFAQTVSFVFVTFFSLLFSGCPGPSPFFIFRIERIDASLEVCSPAEEVTLSVRVKTFGDRDLRYSWSCGSGYFKDGLLSGDTVIWIAPALPGQAAVTVTVTDRNKRLESSQSITIIVAPMDGSNLFFITEGNGTVKDDYALVCYNQPFIISAIPGEGSSFAGWSVESGDGVTIDDAAKSDTFLTLKHGTAVIKAAFAKYRYSITVESSAGGIVTPSGIVDVEWGENKTFTLEYGPDNYIEGVSIDGVAQEIREIYTIENVRKDYTIAVWFGFWTEFFPAYTLSGNGVTGDYDRGARTAKVGNSLGGDGRLDFLMDGSPSYRVTYTIRIDQVGKSGYFSWPGGETYATTGLSARLTQTWEASGEHCCTLYFSGSHAAVYLYDLRFFFKQPKHYEEFYPAVDFRDIQRGSYYYEQSGNRASVSAQGEGTLVFFMEGGTSYMALFRIEIAYTSPCIHTGSFQCPSKTVEASDKLSDLVNVTWESGECSLHFSGEGHADLSNLHFFRELE